MPKLNKKDRRNYFLMVQAAERAKEFFATYVSKHELSPGTLDDVQFRAVMDAARELSATAYSVGMLDAIDVEDGNELEPIK